MSETTDRVCATCATANPETRRFCRQCGAVLARPTADRASPPKSVRAVRRLPTVIGAVAGLVAVAATAGLLSRGGGGRHVAAPPPTSTAAAPRASTTVTSAALRAPARIDPATIKASASSVLPADGPFTYGAGNTLDGNLDTAWNDGSPGSGAGEKLTYRFAGSVQLTSIRLVNGFASTPELFAQNARIRAVVVLTDAGRFPLTLADVPERQELVMDFGRTSSVVLDVVTTYPGSAYEDLAMTEIEFFGR